MELEEEKKTSKKIGIILVILCSCFIFIILYGKLIGTTGLIVKEYKVVNSKIPTSFYGFKIVHMSDIHYGRTVNKKELQNIVKNINLLKPDIVVLTGDLFDQEEILTTQDIKILTEELQKIKVTIGKFAIIGEHDYGVNQWSTVIKNSNFVNLNDTYELIYKDGYVPILLAGLSTNLKGTKNAKDKIAPINDYLSTLNSNEDPNIPNYKILLIHEPDFVSDITSKNYDLILAGHSHNGQIRLPWIGALSKWKGSKKYYDEYYHLNNTDFYISSGLGTTGFDSRLFNRPSINFYRLVNK